VPISDIAFQKRENEMVVATQGRAFWIFDDLPMLYQLNATVLQDKAHLFQPKDTYRTLRGGFRLPGAVSAGQNPAAGAVFYYSLAEKPKGDITLEVLDSSGKLVRKYSSREEPKPKLLPGSPSFEEEEDDDNPRRRSGANRLPTEAGLNRFVWDLHYADATTFPGLILWAGSVRGPAVAPGKYQVRLTLEGAPPQTQSFEVKKDPRLTTTPHDYARQLEVAMQIYNKLSETNAAVIEIRQVRAQLNEYAERVKNPKVVETAKALAKKLTAVEEDLYQTRNRASEDPLNFPIKLNNKIAALLGVVESSDDPPTAQVSQVYEDLATQTNAQLAALKKIISGDLPSFNKLIRDENIPAVVVEPVDAASGTQ
jgi:hypothetical protein